MSQTLKRTKLYPWHVEHGGRMVPFAGWKMPVFYPTGPKEEHYITRRAAGLFDIDHMGQITVSGAEAEPYLNQLMTWDVSLMETYEAHYSLMCYENGGIVDDVFIYKLSDYWLVVVNAANVEKDYRWMQTHASNYEVSVKNISDEIYMIALQGPQAIEVLQTLTPTNLDEIPRFTAVETEIQGIKSLIGRTGYTGEDGVEIFFPPEQALEMWEGILAAGEKTGIEVKSIGLAARDSLRFEPSFSLYGHEIDEDITPLEANLGWVCKFETDFIGKEVLLKQKEQELKKKLIAFELIEKGVPRQGYSVLSPTGEEIGEVVTGLYAPTADKYCGHAFVPPEYASVGTEIQIRIRKKTKAAKVVQRPFYVPAYRRKK